MVAAEKVQKIIEWQMDSYEDIFNLSLLILFNKY